MIASSGTSTTVQVPRCTVNEPSGLVVTTAQSCHHEFETPQVPEPAGPEAMSMTDAPE